MSRNRCNSRALPLALYAGLTLSMTANAFAAGRPHPFVLTAYPKVAGGQDLVTGRYRSAARQLRYGAGAHGPDAAAVAILEFRQTQSDGSQVPRYGGARTGQLNS